MIKKSLFVLLVMLNCFIAIAIWVYSQQRKVIYVDTGILIGGYKGMKITRKGY